MFTTLTWRGAPVAFGAVFVVVAATHLVVRTLVVAAWLTYAALAANLGLWFSLISRTTLRATIFSVLSVLAVGAAPAWDGLPIPKPFCHIWPCLISTSARIVCGIS